MVKDIKLLIESFFDDMFDEHDEVDNKNILPEESIEDKTHASIINALRDFGPFKPVIKNIDDYIYVPNYITEIEITDDDIKNTYYIAYYEPGNDYPVDDVKCDKTPENTIYYNNTLDYLQSKYIVTKKEFEGTDGFVLYIKPKCINESFFDDMFDEHDEESDKSILSDIESNTDLSSYFSVDGLKSINRKYTDNTKYPNRIDTDDFLLYEKYIKLCEDYIAQIAPIRDCSYEIKLGDTIGNEQYDNIIITIPSRWDKDTGHFLIKDNNVYLIPNNMVGHAFFSSNGNSYQIGYFLKIQNILCKYDLSCTHIIMDGNYKHLNIGALYDDSYDKNIFKYTPTLCYFEYEKLNIRQSLSEQIKFDVKISNVYLTVDDNISSDAYIKILNYIKKFSNAKTIHCYTRTEELNKTYDEWSINNKNVLYKFNTEDNRAECVRHIVNEIKADYVKNRQQNFMYSGTWHDKGKDKTYGNYRQVTINIEYDDIDHGNKHRYIDVYVDFYQTGKFVINKVKDNFNEYNK